jgi:hypothetical protein
LGAGTVDAISEADATGAKKRPECGIIRDCTEFWSAAANDFEAGAVFGDADGDFAALLVK